MVAFGHSHLDSAFARVACVDSNITLVVLADQGQGGSEVWRLEEFSEAIRDAKKRRRLCRILLHYEVFKVLATAAGFSPTLTAYGVTTCITIVCALVVVTRRTGVTRPRAILLFTIQEFHEGLNNWAITRAPTKVPVEKLLHVGWSLGKLREQKACAGHDPSGSAEPALAPIPISDGPLNIRKSGLGATQALGGEDVTVIARAKQLEAGVDRHGFRVVRGCK